MASPVHYARLFRRFVGRGATGRWDTILATTTDHPKLDGTLNVDTTIACFEVTGAATAEAARGVVVEWLYRGRPSSMSVTEIPRTAPAQVSA